MIKLDLKALLQKRGYTQQAFAAKAGVSPQTIKAAIDRKLLKADTAEKIATALDKNYSDIFITQKSD